MDKTLKFSVDRMELIDEVNQSQFAKVKIYAFASGENAHDRPVNEDALKRSAYTIYDKPLVWVFDKYSNDIGSHDPKEVPCGFIHRENNPIEFIRLDDGRLMLTIEAMIWKRYSGDILSLFERDGLEKPVSVEIQIIEEKENEQGQMEIIDLVYLCVTILGSLVKPAIALAKAEILAFSIAKQEYDKSFNFQIPEIVKQNAQKGLLYKQQNPKGATAVNISIANQLITNEFASLELINNIYKFSQKAKTDTARYLLGNTEAFEWVDDILNPVLEGDQLNMSVGDDKLGKSPSITIDNSKDSAIMSGSWSDPGATLLDKLLEAKNHTSLIKEGYLVIDGGDDKDLSINDVHYPHHSLKDEELVVNAKGCEAALSRLRSQNVEGEPITHIKKHYKELGLNMDNFYDFGLTEEDYSYLFADEKEGEKMSKKEVTEKFSMTSNEIMDMMNQCVYQVKYQSGDDEYNKYWVSDYDDTYMYCYDSEFGGSVAIPYQYVDEKIQADFENVKRARMAWQIDEDEEQDENYKPMMMALAKAMMTKAGFTTDENTLAVAQEAMNKKEAEYNQKLAEMEANLSEISTKYSTMETQMAEATEKMSTMEEQMAVYMAENTSLKEEKMTRLEQEKMAQIEFTLQEVSDTMPKEKMEEMREDAKNFSAEDLNIWINKVKAEAFSFSKGQLNNEGITRIGLPWSTIGDTNKKLDNVWNRI